MTETGAGSNGYEHYRPGKCECGDKENKHERKGKIRPCKVRGCKCSNYREAA
jgi:hypothetical protein